MVYMPNMDGALVRTLADWGSFFDRDGKLRGVIELMTQDNLILEDVLWKEATDTTGNQTTVRTGLPQVYWRALYEGVPVSKSNVSNITDPVGMLEARSIIDTDLLALHSNNASAYRLAEARPFIEAMNQEMCRALFYGDIKNEPKAINGLHPRYAYKNSIHVVDAGGSGPNVTSMWGVVWGDSDVHGIFPKGSKAGLEHKLLPEFDAHDDNGNAFRAVGDIYKWKVGLAVKDWRSVVRICNIDTTKLELKKDDAGFIDLHRLTIKAKNMVPESKRNRMRWYVNSEVMTALELQASDAGHVHLHYGELFNSKGVPFLHQAPVRQCDAILSTEEALTTLPV